MFHGPFTHVWEVHHQQLGVLDRAAPGAQRALLLRAALVTVDERRVAELGAAASGPGHGAVDAIEVDPRFHTRLPGLSAAGDVSSQMPSVANAVAAGSGAAAMIVGDLMSEAHGLTAS